MTNINLYNLFKESPQSFVDGNVFNVTPIPETNHKMGKSEENYPKFFILTENTGFHTYNLQGEFLSVEYGVNCSLVEEGGNKIDALFSIITLRSSNEGLQQIFMETFSMMLLTLPETPSCLELAEKIEGLLSIFSSLKKTPIHKLQGLWAELLVIEKSKKPLVLAKSWHSFTGAKYDFTKGSDKIEVKSTSSENRIHRFSLDQLNPSSSSNLLIASVIVRESAKDSNGLSVYDMYDKICKKISDVEARMHIYSVITSTLGSDYDKARSIYFDYTSGSDSLEFYDYRDIPRIMKEHIPPFVSAVKFSSDLSNVDNIEQKGISFDEESLLSNI